MKGIVEQKLQKDIGNFLTMALPSDCFWFPIPNGTYSNKVQVANMKRNNGLLPGVPDIGVVTWDGFFFIEVKIPSDKAKKQRKGVLTDSQKLLFPLIRDRGIKIYICHSLNEVHTALIDENVKTRAKVN